MVTKELTFTLEEISQIVGEYVRDKQEIYLYQTIEPYFIGSKLNFRFIIKDEMKL